MRWLMQTASRGVVLAMQVGLWIPICCQALLLLQMPLGYSPESEVVSGCLVAVAMRA